MGRTHPPAKEDRIDQAVADAIEKFGPVMTDREFRNFARVGQATTARWRADGTGPTPLRLGERVIRYNTAEVVTWVMTGEAEQ